MNIQRICCIGECASEEGIEKIHFYECISSTFKQVDLQEWPIYDKNKIGRQNEDCCFWKIAQSRD